MKHFLLIVTLIITACSTTPPKVEIPQSDVTEKVTPMPKEDLMVLDHKYFTVMYDKRFRLARYVVYKVTDDQIKKSIPGIRKDNFKIDPLLKAHKDIRVTVPEYANTGYEKGHLANSKDFSFSREANDTTFYMSNMTPQTKNLNGDD